MSNLEGQIGRFNFIQESAINGNEIYTVKLGETIDRLIVTELGKLAINNDPRILDMALGNNPGKEYLIWDNWSGQYIRPGLRSQIFRNKINTGLFGLRNNQIAIKQPLPTIEGKDSTAIEQFIALETIRSLGFQAVPILLATEKTNRLILRWYKGKHPIAPELENKFQVFLEYLNSAVKELKDSGRWKEDWGTVDRQPRNYFIGDINSQDPRQQFIALDPLSKSFFITD